MEEERPIRDALCTTPVQYRDGFFELPTGPGLGTDLKLEVIKERAIRPQPVSGATESLWR
jgi:galactonate dehydratase